MSAKLTTKEQELMDILWTLKKGYMKDIVDNYPNPKPAYTTIATLLTRMIDKGLISFEQQGKVRMYFPKIKKAEQSKRQLKSVIRHFFDNSNTQFASFFTTETNLSLDELEELKKIIEDKIKKKKK